MLNITAYTVITGGKDEVVKQDYPVVLFDNSYEKFVDPRRNSRIQKMMPHKYFNSEYTIYLDGNMKLLLSPEEIVSRYIDGYDLAMFSHGVRDCIYDEAMTVAKLGLDDTELIIEQAKHYEDLEYGKHKGLFQGGFIVRRNNERTRNMGEYWWADFCRYSRRDQLSLMPAIDKAGVIVNTIPGNWQEDGKGRAWIGDIVEMYCHLNTEGNWNSPRSTDGITKTNFNEQK